MALFGAPASYIGIDLGSSSLKVVELINRRRRIEVASYAEANVPNLLINPPGNTSEEDVLRQTAAALSRLLDQAGSSTDNAVVAIPSGIVFSTVLTLPNIPDQDLDKAVHFAARDVVPADLDDMVLGWSRLGSAPHMDSESKPSGPAAAGSPAVPPAAANNLAPVFITAAPKDVVARHSRLIELAKLNLVALEVETFPLIRSVLGGDRPTALIVDIGDQVTNYHLIDQGTPRVSHTVELGGRVATQAIAESLNISEEEADARKRADGIGEGADPAIRAAIEGALKPLISQAGRLVNSHAQQTGRRVTKTVLIGGSAKLKGLSDYWQATTKNEVFLGNPWKGLSYPRELEQRIVEIAPTYGVAVGLALRNFSQV